MPTYIVTIPPAKQDKIRAIKGVRALTNMGLKEAKDAVEHAVSENENKPVVRIETDKTRVELVAMLQDSFGSAYISDFQIFGSESNIKLSAEISDGLCKLRLRNKQTGDSIVVSTTASKIQDVIERFLDWTTV